MSAHDTIEAVMRGRDLIRSIAAGAGGVNHAVRERAERLLLHYPRVRDELLAAAQDVEASRNEDPGLLAQLEAEERWSYDKEIRARISAQEIADRLRDDSE